MKKQTVRMAATNQDREDNMKNITCKLSLAIIVCATMCLGCKYTYIEVLPPGWKDASAASINDNGDVAGSGIDSTGIQKGFVYSGGNYTELLPPGKVDSFAYSINNNDDVAGGAFDGHGNQKGFVYSGGDYTELLPPGWKGASATSINDNGDVAGKGYDGAGIQKGFVYSGGNYTELRPPGWSRSIKISGLIIAAELSTTSINNKGTVVMTRRIGILIRNIYVYNIVKSFIATPLQLASHL